MQLSPLQLAVNELTSRQMLASRNAMTFGGSDAKRPNAWCEYGFPNDLVFYDLYRMYERHGVAHGVVHRLLDKCWETMPEIIQGDKADENTAQTPWEKSIAKQFKKLKAWKHFKEADRMRMVGHFSGILLQVADGQRWDQPLSAKVGVLVKLIPAWEGQLEPAAWDADPNSPTYGDPSMWSFNEAQVKENDNREPGRAMQVHPSRVYIVGSYRTGVPLLKAGYNDFVTLEKIIGGAGESFLKNASRQLNINFDKDADMAQVAKIYGVPLNELHTAFDDVAKGINRGQDTVLATQGATVSTLVATVPDPEKPFAVALQSACASVQIPVKIVVGMQTGERSSTEDIKDFNRRGQGRRVSELSDDIEGFVMHLSKYRLLDSPLGAADPEVTCVWTDLSEATLAERLANAKLMAETNQLGNASGDKYFTPEQIVTTAGFEVEDMPTPLPDVPPSDEDLLLEQPLAKQGKP